ncbi:diguanylate cyclase [uncultured Desulfuromonas sp.]|uniref:diguanylate cyclase n=1 Tax=uncultured Desulfuromonas sp. TaxID=181013 RepID=UPI00261BDC6C|nr:diguanylate cyclase [uncultured Desulfuromonas sp.]
MVSPSTTLLPGPRGFFCFGLALFLLGLSCSAFGSGRQSTVLTALQTDAAVAIDGNASEAAWAKPTPLEIRVSDGSIGIVTATLKALYDTDHLYLLARWPDPRPDVSKKEWLFDAGEGRWTSATYTNRRGETLPLDEDRFTVMWNIGDSVKGFNTAACAMLCHGDRMHTNGPDERVDIWHWKAARTNPLGYADDKWLDNKIEEGYSHEAREAAHHGDARDKTAGIAGLGGNYHANARQTEIGGQTVSVPWHWEPEAKGEDALFITQEEIASGEAVPVEAISGIDRSRNIPGTILHRPAGSRGDIAARGEWANGFWTLELKRKLVTGQDDDVQFDVRKLYRFGVALMDNSGGFDAYGIGHSFDLGARTLEFGGAGSEQVTTMALARDHLLAGRTYAVKKNSGMARSEIDQALIHFNEVQESLARRDPSAYTALKTAFTRSKRDPSEKAIGELTDRIDHAILLIQGKAEPASPTWALRGLAQWGKIQGYVFLFMGGLASLLAYRSARRIRRKEFKLLAFFILIIMATIILESAGRLGILFRVTPLQSLSFMTSQYAALAWVTLMTLALFIARAGFREIDSALNRLRGQKKTLTELAVRDELTGLFNRRHFQERLSEVMSLRNRYRTPFALLLLDIDHFKKINDTHGHPCGDKVLKDLAGLLDGMVREKIDTLVRYGGEEFAILLYNTPPQAAAALAERIRRGVEEHAFPWQAQRLPVTVSIGVASASGAADGSPDQLVARADRALYRAKDDGRNCVKIHSPDAKG